MHIDDHELILQIVGRGLDKKEIFIFLSSCDALLFSDRGMHAFD